MTIDVGVKTGAVTRYELRHAILLYEAHGLIGDKDVYATIHPIERHRKGGPRIAAGVPATPEACTAFANSIADRAAFTGWIAPEILFVGPRTVAWWRAPAAATVFFETQDEKDPKRRLGIRQGRTPQPGLVYVLKEGEWYVYAVKGKQRPDASTPLFRAPYFNVWKNGEICEGNVARPSAVSPATLAKFEHAFFHSRFTHPNAASRYLTRYRRGVYELWRDLLDGKHKQFPEASLVPHGKHTLDTALRAIEKGDSRDR